METKVTTVIVNDTTEVLTMKVGNRNCYSKLASVGVGGKYTMQTDVNWTYQEFLLQPGKVHCEKQLFISSDDCCDYERITIKENTTDGSFVVERELREQFRTKVF